MYRAIVEPKQYFFGSIATVHNYFWLCKVNFIYLFIFFFLHSHYFSYFLLCLLCFILRSHYIFYLRVIVQWFLYISFCVHTIFPLFMSPCNDFYDFDCGYGCVLVVEWNIILLLWLHYFIVVVTLFYYIKS